MFAFICLGCWLFGFFFTGSDLTVHVRLWHNILIIEVVILQLLAKLLNCLMVTLMSLTSGLKLLGKNARVVNSVLPHGSEFIDLILLIADEAAFLNNLLLQTGLNLLHTLELFQLLVGCLEFVAE